MEPGNSINDSPTAEPTTPNIPVWKLDLYKLQREAPVPNPILCYTVIQEAPEQYGKEFHGPLSHNRAATLLCQDGDYLVRLSGSIFTLSFRYGGKVKHYKLYFDGQHYVLKTRRFDKLHDLVSDGLLFFYMEEKAGNYIALMCDKVRYEKSPAYLTLNRLKKKAKEKEDPVDYDKPHAFKTHNFKGLNWCEFCGNFLWGFTAQGVKCEDCGFIAHTKCGEKLPADCCPDLKTLRGVFGVDLTTLVKAHRTLRPFVVDKCVQEIELRGLQTEGLYRVSGFADEMDSLRMTLDREGENADISADVCENINVVAGILKLYLRLLPIPLITDEAYPSILQATYYQSLKDRVSLIKDALKILPPAHYNTLKYLISHLRRVVDNQQYNKMTSKNISTVFAPTLMPHPDFTAGLPDLRREIKALQTLIDQHDHIFYN
uniref:Beta-chimaerin n=2 Tax=Clastoptera arizonana TaxID=38151 RepID=A0A1B6DY43_9HEMI